MAMQAQSRENSEQMTSRMSQRSSTDLWKNKLKPKGRLRVELRPAQRLSHLLRRLEGKPQVPRSSLLPRRPAMTLQWQAEGLTESNGSGELGPSLGQAQISALTGHHWTSARRSEC